MYKLTKQKTEELVCNILEQAKYYLNQTCEFYPFGAIIDNTGAIKPVSIYWGDDFPESAEVFNKLRSSIQRGISEGNYLCGAIGIDVYANHPTLNQKKDALEIQYYQGDECYTNLYFYYKDKGVYHFEGI